ncbi:MAG: hypothetical protein II917_10985 [Synergistaceae bacterium]|nr:hypothetical protein [Synergistaceae bacterium]
MQENMKLITGKLSVSEFNAFSALARYARESKSALIRFAIQGFIQRNRGILIEYRCFLRACREHRETYPKIREAINLIRETQINALKKALSEEEDNIHAQEI